MNVVSVRKQVSLGRKLDQIREGARRIFLRDGFAAANVDEIAKAAGVSKATLYSYFPDKELMFRDSMQSVFETTGAGPVPAEIDLPASVALPAITVAISDWLCLPLQKQLFRLALIEAERFPKLTANYWSNLDATITKPLQTRLDIWVRHGDLMIEDTAIAVQNLIDMCAAYQHIPAKNGKKHKQDKLRRVAAENAAKIFLDAYRSSPGQVDLLRYGTQ